MEQVRPAVLFVNESEAETKDMTRGLPVEVIQAQHLERIHEAIRHHPIQGVFIDIASIQLEQMEEMGAQTGPDNIPIFILAHASEVPAAIQYVKHGAKGFLLKCLSNRKSA